MTKTLEMLRFASPRQRRARRPRTAIVVVLLASILLAAACGGSQQRVVDLQGRGGAGRNRQLTPAEQKHVLALASKYYHCMQTHGLPNFPDPTTGPNGEVSILLGNANNAIDSNSPQYQTAEQTCQSLHAQLP